MFELEPKNEWIIIHPLSEDERVGNEGLIIAPGNARERQHRLAKVVAVDTASEKCKSMNVGDIVFYDRIGEVEGRVGNHGFVTVKAANVLMVAKVVG